MLKERGLSIVHTTIMRWVHHNIIEQDHRRIKRYVRHSSWFQLFRTTTKTIDRYETMHIIHKGQIYNVAKNDALAQKKFVETILGVAA